VKPVVPKVTVQRLPIYLRCLESLPPGQARISSDELAAIAGVNSAKVRKDLSYLGSYGVRGVGYDVDHLRLQIGLELGLERDWSVVIVGVGNLGRALANYGGFAERRFRIVGLFDSDPRKAGTKVAGHVVEPMDRLRSVVKEHRAAIGIITTPAGSAQEVAETLAAAGVRSILNFAPAVIQAPDGLDVRRVDLSTELQVLSFYLHRSGA
jgi:redox-sensing transcriptional repressor